MRKLLTFALILALPLSAVAAKKKPKKILSSDVEFYFVIEKAQSINMEAVPSKMMLSSTGAGYGKIGVYQASEGDLNGVGIGFSSPRLKVRLKLNNQEEINYYSKMLVECQHGFQQMVFNQGGKVIVTGIQKVPNPTIRSIMNSKNPEIEFEVSPDQKLECHREAY